MSKRKENVLNNRTEKKGYCLHDSEKYIIASLEQVRSRRSGYSFLAQFKKHAQNSPP